MSQTEAYWSEVDQDFESTLQYGHEEVVSAIGQFVNLTMITTYWQTEDGLIAFADCVRSSRIAATPNPRARVRTVTRMEAVTHDPLSFIERRYRFDSKQKRLRVSEHMVIEDDGSRTVGARRKSRKEIDRAGLSEPTPEDYDWLHSELARAATGLYIIK